MDNKEVAKELLRKGILLADPELIAMANKLLGEPEKEESIIIIDSTEPKKRGRPRKTKAPLDREENFSTIRASKNGQEAKWVGNTWKDTGETGDIDKKDLKTPKITPAKRRPKYQKVGHKCSSCLNQVMVYPHDKTEFYKCEKCSKALIGR